MTLKLPFLKRRGAAVDPGVKERIWLNVHWPKGRPTQLVSSCFSGELVMWDLTKASKQRWSLFGSSSEGQNHSRIVFNMSSVQLPDGRELLLSTSMDREVKCWDLSSLGCCWTLPTLGGVVFALGFSPVALGCLAVGAGDNMIRVWSTLSAQNRYDVRTFWQGVKSKVTALAWHPTKEGSLSFGTDDGKVGIYDVFSSKPPQISSSYHKKTVYALAWGPPVPPVSFGAGGKHSFSLYSCAGEGVVLQHDPSRLSGEASDIDQLIRDTNNIQHKLSPHTELTWKPDGKVVAIGNEDGSIEVFRAPDLRLLCSIQQHHKIINTLRWHHALAGPPELHALLASGSSNAIVYVHDLHAVLEAPPERPPVVTEPYRRLCGHTAKVTAMAWSPHHAARLVTASYDGTAQVWDVLEEAAVSNYRGHSGYLLSVDWSPVDPDLVWTGGRDFTVQEWSVSGQEFTKPPKGKKMAMLQEKKKSGGSKQKAKTRPGAAAGSKVNGEKPREASEDEGGASPEPPAAIFEKGKAPPAGKVQKDKPDGNLQKKKKPRSMLPLSTAMDHRPKEDLLQDCVTLAAVTHGHAVPEGCVPGRGDHVHLGLFSDRPALLRMFQAEEAAHVEAGHFESVVYLRLWSGDLEGALQLATERGELNDHLLSIAPMAGFQAWRRASEAFSRQLLLQDQPLKAASHLLSLHRLHDAVELLRAHRLHREAVALVRARLPEDAALLRELHTDWAAHLERDGHLSAAAKSYLAAGSGFDAAKVIARKSDAASLRAASRLAAIAGETPLADSLALRGAKQLSAVGDWEAAQEALKGQEGLLVHRLALCVAELLAAMLEDDQPAVSRHAWAAPAAILDRAAAVWEAEFGVGRRSEGRFHPEALLQQLQAEGPPPSASTPLRQALLGCSAPLAGAVLSGLLGDDGRLLGGVWRAVKWLQDAGHLQESGKLLGMLFPRADWTFCSRRLDLSVAVETAGALQACVCYHRLYACWWGGPGRPVSPAPSSAGPAPSVSPAPPDFDPSFSPAPPDFNPSLLLSAPHAALQQTQSAVRDLQDRLAAMVLQHRGGRGQGGGGQGGGRDQDQVQGKDRGQDQDQDKDQVQDQGKDQDQDRGWGQSCDNAQGRGQDQDQDQVQVHVQDQDRGQDQDQNSDSPQDQVQNQVQVQDQDQSSDSLQGPQGRLNQDQNQVQNQDQDQSSDSPVQGGRDKVKDQDQVHQPDRPQGPQEDRDLDQNRDQRSDKPQGGQNQDRVQNQDQVQDRVQFKDQVQDPSSDSPVKGGQNQEQDQSSDQPETLLSLSAQMSRYQEELAQFPESVKMFPRPDVMECCLVLLHLDQSLGCVPDGVRRDAEALLRKHGSGAVVLRARRRLLTGP